MKTPWHRQTLFKSPVTRRVRTSRTEGAMRLAAGIAGGGRLRLADADGSMSTAMPSVQSTSASRPSRESEKPELLPGWLSCGQACDPARHMRNLPKPTMHPLQPHYLRQLTALLEAETRFLSLLEELQHSVPWVRTCLGGVENDSRQRLDCVRLLLAAQKAPPTVSAVARSVEDGLEAVFQERTNTGRRNLALRLCSRQHRLLVNDYRIAREVAHRLGWQPQAERIDVLLARMTDTFPPCGKPDSLQGLASVAAIAG